MRNAGGDTVLKGAPGQLANLANVPEGGSHDDGLVAVLLVVLVNALHAQHARVFVGLEGAPLLGLVPVHDAPHKRRDQARARVRARCRLWPQQIRASADEAAHGDLW